MPKGLPKKLKGFRFNSQLYKSFKILAAKNGYTVTAAFEKFMVNAVEHGLLFPSDRSVNQGLKLVSYGNQGSFRKFFQISKKIKVKFTFRESSLYLSKILIRKGESVQNKP